ncbi:MAG: peptidylprolyl isomerase [Dehalococcoidia bacterium]
MSIINVLRNRVFSAGVIAVLITAGLLMGCSGSEKDWQLMPPTGDVQEQPKEYATAPSMIIDRNKSYRAVIHTNRGDITVRLFADDTWITVNNFVFLSLERFYDGNTFFRVVDGSFIQTGDPTGVGTGGPGYNFKDESFRGDYVEGAVAMANRGPDTNGSQFFICEEALPDLPKNYTIFGRVTEGMDVVREIASVPVEEQPLFPEASRPTVEVFIETIDIYEAE